MKAQTLTGREAARILFGDQLDDPGFDPHSAQFVSGADVCAALAAHFDFTDEDYKAVAVGSSPWKQDPDGWADFTRRVGVGRRVLALHDDRESEDETAASDLISDVLTAIYGDPRVMAHKEAAQDLLDRVWRSYVGDSEDYDWEVTP